MEEGITKDDLRRFGMLLLDSIKKLVDTSVNDKEEIHPEWLKSRVVRKIMDMSPNSLQSLRISGKVRYKKIMGSYYYNKADLQMLFSDNQK